MSAKQKTIVGLFVGGGFLLFALGLFWIGDRRLLFSENLELETRFANLSALRVGSKVSVSGMDAGEVLAVQVPASPTEKFRVRFRVLSRFQPMLRTDSIASIQVEGLVGSKVLQVDAGSEQGAKVTSGTVLPSREPLENGAVIQQAAEVVTRVNDAVQNVEQRVLGTVDTIGDVGEQTIKVVRDVGSEAADLMTTGKKAVEDVNAIVAGVRQGEGLVGKLLTDDQLYEHLVKSSQELQSTAANVRSTSDDVRRITNDLESRKLGETFQKTASNVEAATARLTGVLSVLAPPGGGADERGLLDQMRDTLEGAREATSDMAENMEALKQNWFFRGYFNRRGFFDLDSISLADYRQGKVAQGRDQKRAWLSSQQLFARDPAGRESLTDAGLRQLGAAVAPYLPYAPNTLLVVEGYSGQGEGPEQYLLSRDRARMVRRYLIERFGLKPNYIGAIPMGVATSAAPSGQSGEGVALVFFPEKGK
jgi:phospholipid/cholesterol/gamma-HCH transport system substrate-binding protein